MPALVTNVLLLQRASSSETIILCVLFVPVQTYLGVVSCHSKGCCTTEPYLYKWALLLLLPSTFASPLLSLSSCVSVCAVFVFPASSLPQRSKGHLPVSRLRISVPLHTGGSSDRQAPGFSSSKGRAKLEFLMKSLSSGTGLDVLWR